MGELAQKRMSVGSKAAADYKSYSCQKEKEWSNFSSQWEFRLLA